MLGTVPVTSAMHARRCIATQLPGPTSPEGFADPAYEMPELPTTFEVADSAFWRAAPSWVVAPPAADTQVEMDGLTPGGRVALRLPEPDVCADYVVGEEQGTVRLAPQVLVLLPDEQRFYMVLRHRFKLYWQKGQERSMRLRFDASSPVGGTR